MLLCTEAWHRQPPTQCVSVSWGGAKDLFIVAINVIGFVIIIEVWRVYAELVLAFSRLTLVIIQILG